MLSPFQLSPQAWQDVLDIVGFIAADNPDAAARFVPALEETCEQFVELHGMWSVRSFHRKDLMDVRMLPVTGFENYLIFYVATKQSIKVLRILHASRDFPTILQ